jgi:hypothetical protein
MRRCVLALCFLLMGAATGYAHDVITTKLTWSAEISRIVFRRCVSCHREGGSAPMSLTSYAEVRPWAKAIRDQVLQRQMPPWGAVRGYGTLKHDQSLTQEEIMRIAEWVEGGAPEGDGRYVPDLPAAASATDKSVTGKRLRVTRLSAPVKLLGLRPLADIPSAKIRAQLPDGSVRPLLWAYGYKSTWNRTFELATAIDLPAGTVIIAEPATPIELVVRSPRRAR